MFSQHLPTSLLRPGIANFGYPERSVTDSTLLERGAHGLSGLTGMLIDSPGKYSSVLATIREQGRLMAELDDTDLARKTIWLRKQLHRHGLTERFTIETFALIRETAGRTIGMRHFDSQLLGGWVMLHGGLAEMETGEGKTLTATLAAATAALASVPVHVITANEYLVCRDARLMGPVYQALGLSVGTATAELSVPQRRDAYACDIVYCTNKQVAFDYLRDRILIGNDQGRHRLQLERLHDKNDRCTRLLLRGLCFAIVDEADSVLVDEARTPLLISREQKNSDEEQTFHRAISLAKELIKDTDYTLDKAERRVELSEEGSLRLESAVQNTGGVWSGIRRREELVCQALAALHLFERDQHYLVKNGKILIIDESTGRVMADRSWQRGIHQMIEIKEHCEVSGQREPLARLTYQRFFRRYLRLAGMTGTAREVRWEMWSVYGLKVFKVPTNRPVRRQDWGQRLYSNTASKWRAVVEQVSLMQRTGRPVLIGTRSVADSEHLSGLLKSAGLTHQVLNARQDDFEAEIIAQAGMRGSITVATNMAGRGTDIPLGRGVAEIGGLHVIAVEKNEARRIDRQLHGRCGRQGDPGSCESILSLEDDLLQDYFGKYTRRLLTRFAGKEKILPAVIGRICVQLAQSAMEKRDLGRRKDLLRADEQLGRLLAFSGRLE